MKIIERQSAFYTVKKRKIGHFLGLESAATIVKKWSKDAIISPQKRLGIVTFSVPFVTFQLFNPQGCVGLSAEIPHQMIFSKWMRVRVWSVSSYFEVLSWLFPTLYVLWKVESGSICVFESIDFPTYSNGSLFCRKTDPMFISRQT